MNRLSRRIIETFATQMTLKSTTWSAAESSRGPWPVEHGSAPPVRRIAVILHLFYPELLQEFLEYLENIPREFDLYVSVVDDDVAARTTCELTQWGKARFDVRVVENRGRDILPKYVTFSDVYQERYDLLLFLHTKRSLTASFGEAWRDYLLQHLLGSTDLVQRSISAFSDNPGLGVLAPAHYGMVSHTAGWDGNYVTTKALARRLGVALQPTTPPDFAAGSMFWARPGALHPLLQLHLRPAHFAPESGQVSGTVAHALERLVFVSAEAASYVAGELTEEGALIYRSSGARARGTDDERETFRSRVRNAQHISAAIASTAHLVIGASVRRLVERRALAKGSP